MKKLALKKVTLRKLDDARMSSVAGGNGELTNRATGTLCCNTNATCGTTCPYSGVPCAPKLGGGFSVLNVGF